MIFSFDQLEEIGFCKVFEVDSRLLLPHSFFAIGDDVPAIEEYVIVDRSIVGALLVTHAISFEQVTGLQAGVVASFSITLVHLINHLHREVCIDSVVVYR